MLLKKPESTASLPLMSRAQVCARSFETMPSSTRRSNTFQRSWPRMRRAEPCTGIAFARDGFDQRRLAGAVGAEDGDVLALGDGERERIERALGRRA